MPDLRARDHSIDPESDASRIQGRNSSNAGALPLDGEKETVGVVPDWSRAPASLQFDGWNPPTDLDPECLALCLALNQLSGIRTISSCCGHDQHPYRVFLVADSFDALVPVAYYVQECHGGVVDWKLLAETDCAMSPLRFVVEGPRGDYQGAEAIARGIRGFHA